MDAVTEQSCVNDTKIIRYVVDSFDGVFISINQPKLHTCHFTSSCYGLYRGIMRGLAMAEA